MADDAFADLDALAAKHPSGELWPYATLRWSYPDCAVSGAERLPVESVSNGRVAAAILSGAWIASRDPDGKPIAIKKAPGEGVERPPVRGAVDLVAA